MPEEAKRGGTDTTATERPLEDQGQSITIHAARENDAIFLDHPSIAQEFL